MKTTFYTLAALVSALTAQAIMVTSPDQYTVWSSTANSSTAITWSSVSTDPSTFDIYLVDMTSSPSYSSLLASDVSTNDGSYTVSGNLHTGDTMQVNFVAPGKSEQIYAQSGQFDVVEAPAVSSISAAASGSSTSASASPTSAAAAVASGSASASSARSVDASSSMSAAAAVASSASGSATSSMRSAASSISRAAASASGSGSAAAASASGSAAAPASAGVSNVKMPGAALLGMGVAVIAGGALVM
ncbi:hypothetical protein YB2330_006027 [Saitoella coloradoensis]